MLPIIVNFAIAVVGFVTAPANVFFADPRMECELVHAEATSRLVMLSMPRCVRDATVADSRSDFAVSSVVETGVYVELPR